MLHRKHGLRLQQLQHMGLVAPWHVESSGTCVPCIDRWILNHWTTRKALEVTFYGSMATPTIHMSPVVASELRWQS